MSPATSGSRHEAVSILAICTINSRAGPACRITAKSPSHHARLHPRVPVHSLAHVSDRNEPPSSTIQPGQTNNQYGALAALYRAVRVDIPRQWNRPLEDTISALHDMVSAVVRGTLPALFSFQIEHVASIVTSQSFLTTPGTSSRTRKPLSVSSISPVTTPPFSGGGQCTETLLIVPSARLHLSLSRRWEADA